MKFGSSPESTYSASQLNRSLAGLAVATLGLYAGLVMVIANVALPQAASVCLIIGSFGLFFVFLFIQASRLGKSTWLWLFAVFVTSPVGQGVALFFMFTATQEQCHVLEQRAQQANADMRAQA